MHDLPVILKCDNLHRINKALDFFIELNFCKSGLYFLNRHKNVRWPLITSFQCIKRRLLEHGHFRPKGNNLNNFGRGLLGDATYQISRLYAKWFQRRCFMLSLYMPM